MTICKVKIVLSKDGVYDVYDKDTGEWILSRTAPENIMDWLAEQGICEISFIDKNFECSEG